MNRRWRTVLALAAALIISGCTAATEQSNVSSLHPGAVSCPLPDEREPAFSKLLNRDDPEYRSYIDPLCRAGSCREAVVFELVDASGAKGRWTIKPAPPVVQAGKIAIFPGETINIEADDADGALINLRAVQSVKDASKTIVFTLKQDLCLTKDRPMLLQIFNPFSRAIKFHVGMVLPRGKGIENTSSCPVAPRGMNYEMWPHPIFRLLIANVHFLGRDESQACVF